MNILFLGNRNEIPNWLEENSFSVFKTQEKIDAIFASSFDWIVSYGYRHILKKEIIDAVNGKAINLHISYLPWNRGTDPNFWSHYEDTPAGVTIHFIDEGIDTGPIITQKLIRFTKQGFVETYNQLQEEIQELFYKTWHEIIEEKIKPIKQDLKVGSYHTLKDRPCENLWVFEDITKEHYNDLYLLLIERDPKISISHRNMPTYKDHCMFWDNKPYKFAKAINGLKGFMGYTYVTERNEVGVHIKREFQKQGIGTSVFKKLINTFDELLVNIAPENEVALKLVKKLGFDWIQETYRISHGKT